MSHSGHDHHNAHRIGQDADLRTLTAALVLLAVFMAGEIAVGFAVHSLVLLSDAGHMLADTGAIAGSIWAIVLAGRPARGIWTFGWKRAEILSAAANGITLLVVSGLVTFEAVRRLVHPPTADGGAILAVALVGVAVNLAATRMLARANRSSLNIEGAYRHVLTDLYGFGGTAVAAVVIMTTGYQRADAIAALAVVALMLRAAWGLLNESGRILLEAAPRGVDLAAVRDHLLETQHVRDVHDLHVWTLTSDLPTLSAHIVVDDECFTDGHVPQLLDQVQACLGDHFDVEHSTFQFEPARHADHEAGAHA